MKAHNAQWPGGNQLRGGPFIRDQPLHRRMSRELAHQHRRGRQHANISAVLLGRWSLVEQVTVARGIAVEAQQHALGAADERLLHQ